MGPLVLLKVYGIALNMMKNTGEPQETPFYYVHHLLGRTTHAEMTNVVRRFKHILGTHVSTTVAAGGGYTIIIAVHRTYYSYIFAVMIFLDYIDHLYVFFKLLQISKTFSSVFIFVSLYIIGTVRFKPMLFKGQLFIKRNVKTCQSKV